jgi:hypothetical protein
MGSLVSLPPRTISAPRPLSRGERRRLARWDAGAARLAELHAIGDLLSAAAPVVGSGWVQHAWFAVATPRGERLLAAHQVKQVYVYPVTGACLAGAIVIAAGGPDQAATQLVQRTLDLTWHALRDDPEPTTVLCPSPPVRTMRLLDLTRWNDASGRTRTDVTDVLRSAENLAGLHSVTQGPMRQVAH